MPANGTIFKHLASYSGITIELSSDSRRLLSIDFVKGKKSTSSGEILSGPIKKAIIFLDDYFRGVKSEMEIQFNTESGQSKFSDKQGNELILDMSGFTEKEIRVYRTLIKVNSGKTISYNELASKSGIDRGARFAGNCMAANRFPIIIPCHRVIKNDGSTGNYSGGVEIKEFLLKHETGNSFSKK